MNWALAGLVYACAYVAIILALGEREYARLLVGTVALLIPPIAPIIVMLSRRGDWRGRPAGFLAPLGAGAMLLLIGQIGWSGHQRVPPGPPPPVKWHTNPQLLRSAPPPPPPLPPPPRR